MYRYGVNPVGLSVPYVMMRQPLFDGCNALPCQSGDTDTCSSCTAELGSGTIAAGMQACSLSPFPFPMTSFFPPDIQTQYGCGLSPLGGETLSPRGLLPVFWPRWLPGLPCRPSSRLLAAQQPSAYQRSRPSVSFFFGLAETLGAPPFTRRLWGLTLGH